MSTERTLATRFRSQRTDRLWLDDVEVHSVLTIPIEEPTVFEFVFEYCRDDTQEVLVVSCAEDIRVNRTSPPHPSVHGASANEITLVARPQSVTEVQVDTDERVMVRIWNAWLVDQARHGWIGNHGLVVDDLETPSGASRRFRLWASDGFGDPSFDDLVCTVTVAGAPTAGFAAFVDGDADEQE